MEGGTSETWDAHEMPSQRRMSCHPHLHDQIVICPSTGQSRKRRRGAGALRGPLVIGVTVASLLAFSSYATGGGLSHEQAVQLWRWKRSLQLKTRKLRHRLVTGTRGGRTKAEGSNAIQRKLQPPAYQKGSPWYESIGEFPCYRTVAGTFATMDDMAEKYPKLAAIKVIGQSYEGRDLRVMVLTNRESVIPAKRKGHIFLTFGIHPREKAPVELGTRFMEHVLDNYEDDADVNWVLNYNVIHLLLIANPDGRVISENNPYSYQRKNGNESNNRRACGRNGQSGVDLNRNFGFFWGRDDGSSNDPCDETYRGPRPASEPETKAIIKYAKQIFPKGQWRKGAERKYARPLVERRTRGVYVDVHAYGELIVSPWGFTRNERAPNWDAYKSLVGKLSNFNGYEHSTSTLPSFMYEVSGDTIDFMYGKAGVASVLFEIGDDFLQDCNTFDNDIVEDNLFALFYATKVSRKPFQTTAGIDVKKISLSNRGVVSSGQTLYVDIDMEGQNIFSTPSKDIRLYLDAHPYDRPPPEAILMSRTLPGRASARLDTTGLDEGRHKVCIEVTDRKMRKGAVTCEFFQVRSIRERFDAN